jgi:eukaryotic-like serine/threonine-protein kinase
MLLVGRYRLVRPVGAGGMGDVWAAHDMVLGRDVAIKAQELRADGDHAWLERFQREAQSAAVLQHPNVVTIFDSGAEGGTAFLVMELLPGPNIEAHLAERGPLPEQKVIALTKGIAAGLAAAHAAGVVHRDIKPANLMFDARGALKIVDFGIAHLAQTAATRLTATNTVIGSASYLAPEQVQGRRADERSDLYALGCVMTTMLTGRPPFEGEHPWAVMHQHVSVPPPRIGDRRPGVRPAVEALVAELLSKRPQDRPRSALAVLDRLRHLEHGRSDARSGSSASTTAVLGQRTVLLPVLDPAEITTRVAAYRRPLRRVRWVVGGVAAVAFGALVLIAIAPTAAELPANDSAQPRSVAPTSTAPNREPTSTAPSPEPTPDISKMPRTRETFIAVRPEQAVSDLRAAVGAASSSGQIEEEDEAEELSELVDELGEHLAEDGVEDSDEHVKEINNYLRELSKEGELSQDGMLRIADALQTVREVIAEG